MSRKAIYAIAPLSLLGLILVAFVFTNPLAPLESNAPPSEHLTVERTILDDRGVTLEVRAMGPMPVEIAQIQVDGAYWRFKQEPPKPVDNLGKAKIRIPYPWIENETHRITLVTRSGLTFDHVIEVSRSTPVFGLAQLANFGLLGVFVGVLPVALGMMFFPLLQRFGQTGMTFLLSLTVGLLAFLLIDTLNEALELANRAAPGLRSLQLVWLATLASLATLLVASNRSGSAPEKDALATFIAAGIGLHNFGEGLAIGAAFTAGEAALGSFLIAGFTLHNITEGICIAVLLVGLKPRFRLFVGLTTLAGAPAILGTWAGAFATAPHWTALLLSIGAGAILQVIVEIGRYMLKLNSKHPADTSWSIGLAGFAGGVVIMYATSLLIVF
jgi:ZIP family zinc transporter